VYGIRRCSHYGSFLEGLTFITEQFFGSMEKFSSFLFSMTEENFGSKIGVVFFVFLYMMVELM